MPEVDFFTSANMALLWGYVKMLVSMASPGMMISFAITCVGFLLIIVVKAFRSNDDDKNDDDEIEVRHY